MVIDRLIVPAVWDPVPIWIVPGNLPVRETTRKGMGRRKCMSEIMGPSGDQLYYATITNV